MAVCLAISAVAVVAGFWQHGRHVDRADARAAYDAAVEAPPAEVVEVAPAGAAVLPDGAEWRTVTATGTINPESVTVLRGRPIDRTASWQYLAWLETDAGEAVLVSLGWVPQPEPDEEAEAPVIDPDAIVTVTGVLRAWEEDDGRESSDSVTRITPAQLPVPDGAVVPGYVMVRELCDQEGCAPSGVGEQVPLPELTLGPHLSYAFQWWIFALLAPVGGILLLRRDARLQDESEAPPASAAQSRVALRRSRSEPSDEEIEDAL